MTLKSTVVSYTSVPMLAVGSYMATGSCASIVLDSYGIILDTLVPISNSDAMKQLPETLYEILNKQRRYVLWQESINEGASIGFNITEVVAIIVNLHTRTNSVTLRK